jgi:hypothetical protein
MNKHKNIGYFVLGSLFLLPCTTFAGGIDLLPLPASVDIPDMRGGWGASIEVAALKPYNNNLNYFLITQPLSSEDGLGNAYQSLTTRIERVDPIYAPALRVGINYTFADKGNVLKLNYEHLFDKEASDFFQDIPNLLYTDASVRQKLDGISLVSEQHILIGPYWETTLTIGARYAHLRQELAANFTNYVFDTPTNDINFNNQSFSVQFDGTGPLVGLGTIFLLTDKLALGAEVQGALLVGRNNLDITSFNERETPTFTDLTYGANELDHVYSIVPELFYRIYANYFYRFANGSELQMEAGWRTNQFFNLRTFDFALSGTANPATHTSTPFIISPNTTRSDDIAFGGPYVMFNYKL